MALVTIPSPPMANTVAKNKTITVLFSITSLLDLFALVHWKLRTPFHTDNKTQGSRLQKALSGKMEIFAEKNRNFFYSIVSLKNLSIPGANILIKGRAIKTLPLVNRMVQLNVIIYGPILNYQQYGP